LVFHSSTIAMMHGPINIRFILQCLTFLEVADVFGGRSRF